VSFDVVELDVSSHHFNANVSNDVRVLGFTEEFLLNNPFVAPLCETFN
jgi:hypothetical protein